ncbi:unnamed protein product [Larinioides sclopetarius]|uniref:Uncharacterized protein n=1 Tax=Larinioides sclopetarius TaxID=280406 RepID=A0AAV2AMG1_9ARAC
MVTSKTIQKCFGHAEFNVDSVKVFYEDRDTHSKDLLLSAYALELKKRVCSEFNVEDCKTVYDNLTINIQNSISEIVSKVHNLKNHDSGEE